MRKLLPQFLLITLILTGVGFFVMPHAAHAQAVDTALSLLSGGFDLFYGLVGKIFWWVLIPLAGVVLHLLGTIIDGAIDLSMTPALYSSPAIGAAWTIIRDLTNMLFIFVLIYEGIRTILNLGNAAKIRKTITSVVIAALLLNFSLFFTKVFIDTSNLSASWFIQGIKNISGGSASATVSSSIRATLQMEKLTNTYGDPHLNGKSFTLQSFTQGILLFVLTCVAIYVFFRVTSLIIGRIVAFMVLLITSPVGFTAILLDLGEVTGYAKKWWSEMIGQMFMLPLFFLMLYITLFIVDKVDQFTTASTTGTDFAPINYIIFIIIIMLLLRALKIAEEHSGDIGSTVAKFTQQAFGIAAGGIAMGTFGKAAAAIQKNERFQRFAAENGVMGQLALQGVKGTASAGFGVKSNFSGLAKTAGINNVVGMKDAFKGADKGYSGKVEQEKKDRREYMKLLGKGPKGTENRRVYSDNLQSGLYGRIFKSGGAGAVAGGLAGGLLGPAGVAGGAVLGAYLSKKAAESNAAGRLENAVADKYNAAKAGIDKATGNNILTSALGAPFENQSIKEIKKDTEKEYAKDLALEQGKAAIEAKIGMETGKTFKQVQEELAKQGVTVANENELKTMAGRGVKIRREAQFAAQEKAEASRSGDAEKEPKPERDSGDKK